MDTYLDAVRTRDLAALTRLLQAGSVLAGGPATEALELPWLPRGWGQIRTFRDTPTARLLASRR